MHRRNSSIPIPGDLRENCRRTAEGVAWLGQLPGAIDKLLGKWRLIFHSVYEGATCAWVASVESANGERAVLKLGLPHMEARDEAAGLRFWDGEPTARLLQSDEDLGAMLIERCEPGASLRSLNESEQTAVIAGLLRRLWRKPVEPHSFRPLSSMLQSWSAETQADAGKWSDGGLVREGLQLFTELSQPSVDDVLLATDLHAGNVLQSKRQPWLVIDPKPFVGDPAYDLTQHLFNCSAGFYNGQTTDRFADLAGVDAKRVRLWTFARAAAAPRQDWDDKVLTAIARAMRI